jgi:hypothetical protein
MILGTEPLCSVFGNLERSGSVGGLRPPKVLKNMI